VITALIEMGIGDENNGAGTTALRGFRIMRVLKVLKRFKKLRILSTTLINSFKESLNLVLLIGAFLFLNGLVGKQIFGRS